LEIGSTFLPERILDISHNVVRSDTKFGKCQVSILKANCHFRCMVWLANKIKQNKTKPKITCNYTTQCCHTCNWHIQSGQSVSVGQLRGGLSEAEVCSWFFTQKQERFMTYPYQQDLRANMVSPMK
jgi:hypothetical protein